MELDEVMENEKDVKENVSDALNKKEDISLSNDLQNEITNENNVTIEEKQNKFLEGTLGKVINTGVDIALRAVLPNVIEDEVIGIKNVIINEGFGEGIKSAINSASNLR